MNEEQRKLAEKILAMLERQKFADWYCPGGRFDDYIAGTYPKDDPACPTKEQILENIVEMANL